MYKTVAGGHDGGGGPRPVAALDAARHGRDRGRRLVSGVIIIISSSSSSSSSSSISGVVMDYYLPGMAGHFHFILGIFIYIYCYCY